MSSGKICPGCGCPDIDKDAATGGAYCTHCGTVLEENTIVAEVEFFETGSGGHGALGQFVSADAPSKLRIGSMPGVSTRESREVTLLKAKRLINEVAGQLGGLNQHCKDVALNFFNMAVRGGFTRGRRSTHMIAACLYITCRLEGTPHLLLDFSDVLRVNVYELGKVYNFVARTLMITLPRVDPCDYIMRFAHCLNFGDKEHDVAMVALRLVQRMKRDWMAFGRRPTGLCGAALLLAARYHNFNRTVNDVVQIVNISESVIRKRLEEFSATPSSELTLDEFQTVDLEQTCDPPAFREARDKAKRPAGQTQPDFKSMEKELLAKQAEVEAALSSISRRQPGTKSKKKQSDRISILGDDEIVDESVREFVEEELLSDIISEESEGATSTQREEEPQTPAERYRALRPTLESLGITKNLCNNAVASTSTAPPPEDVDDTILTSDIDDDEINSYLLNDDEVKMKEEMWMAHYEEFVVALEEKRRIKEEERLKEEQEGGPKKKRAAVRKKKPAQPGEPAATASEAIEKMVQEKKLSNKINYEVLKSLVVEKESAIGQEAAPIEEASTASKAADGQRSRFKPYPIKKPEPSTAEIGSSSRRFRGARLPPNISGGQRLKKEEARTEESVRSVNID